MPSRLRTKPRSEAPSADLVALDWIRIQVVARLRPVNGTAIEPATLRLRFDADPRVLALPMRAWAEDRDVVARFNVMHGPDQMPLSPGRWTLVVEDPGEPAPLPVAVSPGVDLADERRTARFRLTRGDFVVRPIAGGDGRFGLEVALREVGAAVPRIEGSEESEESEDAPSSTRSESMRVRVVRRIVRFVRHGSFAVLLRVFSATARRDGRRILFTSDSRAELGGNLKVVHDRMKERGLDSRYRLRTLFKPSIAHRRSLIDRLRLPWEYARADAIFIDDYQPSIYRINDSRTRIIQLWHASGAFKTVGYSRVGKPDGVGPYSRIHKSYTYAIVSSDFDVPFYAEAFGIREERVIPTGIPRMDRFFDERHGSAARAEALAAYPHARGRFVILFAPTFRGPTRSATYATDRLDLAALHALAVERDAVVILKLHPFVREPLVIPEEFADRLLDGSQSSIDVNDLLFVVDLLVTDYSSIVFEFSVLGRPMLFYAYDLEQYIAERDFYVPFEEFCPGRIVTSFDELLDAIRREDYQLDKVAPFAARHFAHLDGGSTDRVIDLVLAP